MKDFLKYAKEILIEIVKAIGAILITLLDVLFDFIYEHKEGTISFLIAMAGIAFMYYFVLQWICELI